MLAAELDQIKAEAFDLGLVGFSHEETDSIFAICEDAPHPWGIGPAT